jgi:hypothetical protein
VKLFKFLGSGRACKVGGRDFAALKFGDSNDDKVCISSHFFGR